MVVITQEGGNKVSSRTSNLKIERIKRGLTQAELAEKIDVGLSTIVRWEDCPDSMPTAKAIALADLFDCTLDYLLREDGST